MSERIGKIFKHFVVAAFCAIVVVTLVQVFMRYVLSSPLTWAEELSRYIFVWAIMVSIGIGVVDEAHIRLNMVTTRFGKKAQFGFYLLGQVIMVQCYPDRLWCPFVAPKPFRHVPSHEDPHRHCICGNTGRRAGCTVFPGG